MQIEINCSSSVFQQFLSQVLSKLEREHKHKYVFNSCEIQQTTSFSNFFHVQQ